MAAHSVIVSLSQVDVEIATVPVLHAIDLELARGAHLGLVGGNGSGKSTLLALIAGRRWPAPVAAAESTTSVPVPKPTR